MVVEIALTIPPGKTRVPKGILGPLAERYVIGPDWNVNDLGFFASLKSRVWGMNASSIDELVETIFQQYEEYDSATLERVGRASSRFTTRHYVRWAITTVVWSIPG